MAKPTKQTFSLTLQPEGRCDDAEAYRRLKGALKSLLRCYRLRCVKVTTAEGTATAEQVIRERL